MKDHEGEISLSNAGEGSETEREFDSSEEFDTDEDYDSDAHENGDPDEEHRHEPGGSGDVRDDLQARVLHSYDSNVLLPQARVPFPGENQIVWISTLKIPFIGYLLFI